MRYHNKISWITIILASLSCGLTRNSYALCCPTSGFYTVALEQVTQDGGPFYVIVLPHAMKWLRLNKNGSYVTGYNPTVTGHAKQSNCSGKYIYVPKTKTIVWLSGWLKGYNATVYCNKGKKADIFWTGDAGTTGTPYYPNSTRATWKKP